ncbi:MAG: carbohydrate-binding domain-containing protein, partial [Clostridia bacterium]|nr:carbohydrate-binding domain-containing protein [Clostridia bacterium]
MGDGNFTITTSDGNVTKNGDVYTVSAAGTYTLTGTLADGQIIINAGDDDEVELELNGADISCSTDSPIYAVNADKVKIKATEGTVNSVTDARNYV